MIIDPFSTTTFITTTTTTTTTTTHPSDPAVRIETGGWCIDHQASHDHKHQQILIFARIQRGHTDHGTPPSTRIRGGEEKEERGWGGEQGRKEGIVVVVVVVVLLPS